MPANYPRDFRWAITNAWIAGDHASPGEHYVTSSGEEALNSHFSTEIKKKTGQGKGTRRTRRKKTDGESD